MVNADMALGTPDLVNRLSVRDASDPLHVRVGNPYLQNSWRYNFRTGFLHRSPEKKWFTQVNVNAWLGVNDVHRGSATIPKPECTLTVRRTWTATGASMEVWHFRKKVWPNIGMWERI